MTSSEKIMVCVYHGPNGERLIRRGGELARLLDCPLYVLSVIPVQPEALDQEQENYMALWQIRCDEWGATFIVKSSEDRKPSEVIAETAKQHRVTQLIIGQPGQTRWQEILRGSIVNELLNRLSEVDIHIVSVQRMDDSSIDSHESGIRVGICRAGQHYRICSLDVENEPIKEGIFFKDLYTDFDNGLLKIKSGNRYKFLKVVHGGIEDPSFLESENESETDGKEEETKE